MSGLAWVVTEGKQVLVHIPHSIQLRMIVEANVSRLSASGHSGVGHLQKSKWTKQLVQWAGQIWRQLRAFEGY